MMTDVNCRYLCVYIHMRTHDFEDFICFDFSSLNAGNSMPLKIHQSTFCRFIYYYSYFVFNIIHERAVRYSVEKKIWNVIRLCSK